MPSPIAHLSAGYAIYRYNKSKFPQGRHHFWIFSFQMLLVMALSMLPDLDVFLALAFGDMEKYHNNFSHSFLFALPVALVSAGVFYGLYRSRFWLWFTISLLSYHLHVIMDFFTAERGVMLFWPITDARFASPVQLFYGLQWGLGWFSVWHLWTIFTESLFAIVIISAVIYIEKRKLRRSNSSPRTIQQQEKL